MFKLFEPNQDYFQKDLPLSFFKVLQENSTLCQFFQDPEKCTIMLSQQEENNRYGGAILLKKRVSDLPLKTRKAMAPFASKEGEVWTCTVYLHLEKDNFFPDFEPYCKLFYQKLYESLVEFGQKNKIGFLCMVLVPGEYLCTEVVGLWPYVVEVRPQESLDGLFHGVLSLATLQPVAPTNVWQTLSHEVNKLAA